MKARQDGPDLFATAQPVRDERAAAAEWLARRSHGGASYTTHTGEYATADDAGPPAASREGPCERCGDAGAFYDGMTNGGEYAIRCSCGAPVDARRGFRFEPRVQRDTGTPAGLTCEHCGHVHEAQGHMPPCCVPAVRERAAVYANLTNTTTRERVIVALASDLARVNGGKPKDHADDARAILDAADTDARANGADTSADDNGFEDGFEDEDGPEYVDEGADPDAAWTPDELLDESAGNDDARPEPAPVCDECKISATIHEWASPHGRDGFPCPPGSFERDRASFEASIRVGDRRGEGVVTRVAYSRRTLDEKPAWYHERTRGDVTCYPASNCYGTLWVERRKTRADLFTAPEDTP